MSKILITGATGTVGSMLVPALSGQGSTVRALIHHPDHAERLSGHAVELAFGDFADPATIRSAMRDVDAVFLACGNVPDQVSYECAVIDEAVRSGVRRIVKLSARGAEIGSPVAYWDWHGLIERHLRASGIPSVVLQPGFLMTNLLAAAQQVSQQGMLFAPAGSARIAMIDPADIAAAAAVALTGDDHDGATYVLTGPAAITYQQVALELSAATGRTVGFADIPAEAATAAMIEAGLPPFVVDQVVSVFGQLQAGVQSKTSDAVQLVTGRPARPLAVFARNYAGAFSAVESGNTVNA